ncbi:MAG: polysaccharide pyruvyl transferase CsaB [Clostridia bacterium]|nr:polysaccharide pyruvyl transferase CsaB [Clostridia bacterium]
MADILISGYHGFANSGDEALLFAILNTLRKKRPELDFTVLSNKPEETSEVYNVNSIGRYNLFKIRKEMKKSKMLLFGGGSLLQDVTSSKSILYYLAIIRLAQKCGMKTMLYANGIGPITKKRNRTLAAKILNKVDFITLRDDKSDEELKSLGVTKPKIIITADPAFTIDTEGKGSGRFFTNIAGVPSGTKLCIVSIRAWKNSSPYFCSDLAKLCDQMVENHGIYPLFVPMQYPEDTDISKNVMSLMKKPSYIISRELSVPEMFSVLSEAEILIGMRLHSLIYATTLAIPAMPICYDPKISAFMESLNQPDRVDVESFDYAKAERLLNTIILEKNERRENLRKTNEVLRRTAEKNAEFAIELLEE